MLVFVRPLKALPVDTCVTMIYMQIKEYISLYRKVLRNQIQRLIVLWWKKRELLSCE